jgi:hypothetical protein
MKFTFLGTAAANAFPEPFCSCDNCVDTGQINKIVLGKRPVTADTALRFYRFFGNPAKFWMDLQVDYEVDVAKEFKLLEG